MRKVGFGIIGLGVIAETHFIAIEKNENCANLLILNKQKDRFYDILKEKLHWSISPKK